MELTQLGEIIATRKLSVSGSTEQEIEILIGRPLQYPKSSDYYVPYQIVGIGDEKIRYAGGIDSIQCLQLVMKMIYYDVGALNEKLELALRWQGDEAGDLGFTP